MRACGSWFCAVAACALVSAFPRPLLVVAWMLLAVNVLVFCAAVFICVSFQTEVLLSLACAVCIISIKSVGVEDCGHEAYSVIASQCTAWGWWLLQLFAMSSVLGFIALNVDTSPRYAVDKDEGEEGKEIVHFVFRIATWGVCGAFMLT